LDELPDRRLQEAIIYDRRFLAWWGIALFVFKLGSRRQLDFDLREGGPEVLSNLNRLAETLQKTLPHHDTLDYFVGRLGAAPLADLRTMMVRRLVRMKALDANRLQGRFVIAVDGTGYLVFRRKHCDRCLVRRHGTKTYYLHQVLEAKLVGPAGLALSVGTEFIENADAGDAEASPERIKQDCELNALIRLAPALKRDFPQMPICLTGDALYACGRVFALAEKYRWSYFLTFKPGQMPAVWDEFQRLLKLSPQNTLRIEHPNGVRQVYRWINGLSYHDDQGQTHAFNALQCKETAGGKTTTFAWITDRRVTEKNVIELATKGGRIRWKIENEGFNLQKNSDLNLEHAYGIGPERMKAYYYLLQIAHIMLQLLERGSLLRRLAQRAGKTPMKLFGSLKNLARRLLECFRYLSLPDEVFDSAAAARIQIRLDGG